MAIIVEFIEIKQPVTKVFAYVADIKNLPEWEFNILEAEQTSPGPMDVGITLRGVNRAMGQNRTWTSKITEYEPDKGFSEVITSGSTRIDGRLTFESTDTGTKLTHVCDVKIGGFRKFMSPIAARSKRKHMKANLENLKNILEGNS
jgi:uncharacterized protein YndB with AHSA1/START domain